MSKTFILIPGRTSDQGCGISEGKFGEKYQTQINALQMNPADIEELGLAVGDRVVIRSEWGAAEVNLVASRGDELPVGLLFIAYGDVSSSLMGADTHGTGMPTSKGFDVTVEKAGATG